MPVPAAAVGLARRAWRSLPVGTRRALAYRRAFGAFPRRRDPRTFNEKLDRRLLADRRPRLVTACDKLAAKDAAAAAGVPVARTLWVGTDVRGLVDADLGAHWVLKPNHRSGGLVHHGHGAPDRDALEVLAGTTHGWLDPGTDEQRMGEWGYSGARRVLLVEERLGDPAADLADWKVHVIGGEPVLVQVHTGRFGDHRVRWYRPDWTPTDVTVAETRPADLVPPPAALPALLATARRLAAGWDYVRVDLYLVPDGTGTDRVVFGELTVYPGSGLTDFREHPELDRELGDRWVLPPDVAPRAARRGRRSTPVRGRG